VQLATESNAFAAHVAFYPWCGEQHVPVKLTGAPLLYLVGARDDWTGSAPCVDYVERVRRAGYPVKLVLYPDAEHGFDYPGRFRRYLANAESWAACNYIGGSPFPGDRDPRGMALVRVPPVHRALLLARRARCVECRRAARRGAGAPGIPRRGAEPPLRILMRASLGPAVPSRCAEPLPCCPAARGAA